ncbi:MAG: hypothetical protein A2051_06870 [Desulfovibrionales bacterium GWA2_65_9]|nr:MAG: hypothetical protein A2051_06870 [Desulfovibrionales bacterium GWA2_65_9]
MPTETMRRGTLRWRAVVKMEGKIVASRWFDSGRKEERKAILWERDKRRELLESQTLQTVPLPLAWAVSYLEDAQRRRCKKTVTEKRSAMSKLLEFIGEASLAEITPGVALRHMQAQCDCRSGNSANRDRKNLAAAWVWGRRFMEGFPAGVENPFLAVERFPEKRTPRYVPPENDFWRVLEAAQGQNRVMLLAYFYTAARREELFRLKWEDVDFGTHRVRLYTRKTKGGSWRADWLPLLPELRPALLWWRDERPYKTEHVFTCLDDSPSPHHSPGEPYRSRQHFMATMCRRAEVKPFGLHAIRHLRAVTLYKAGARLHEIQKWLRHENASTTERYLKSLGLDLDGLREVAMRDGGGKVLPFPQTHKASVASSFGGFAGDIHKDIHRAK